MTAKIYYAEIGEGMSRIEKLNRLNELGDIDGVDWQEIIPNEHGDWINQRGDEFFELKPIEDFFKIRSSGIGTSRDAWVWNFSRGKLIENMRRTIDFYNSQLGKENLDRDPKKISWSDTLENRCLKNIRIEYDESKIFEGLYRPFCREWIYFDKNVNEVLSQMPKLFPNGNDKNILISLPGATSKKDFMPFITNRISDLNSLDAGTRCFPRYYFDGNQMIDAIDSDDLFYYIYGFLHLPEYRERFANDLKKSLPRIKIIEGSDFEKISRIGRALADLHLNYETQSPPDEIILRGIESGNFRVKKIRFDKKNPTRIIFNESIWIENVPLEVNDYRVNGRSPVEWIIERYQIKVDKASGIVNDPNDWSSNPRYILDLLLSAMAVSLETQRLISELPRVEF